MLGGLINKISASFGKSFLFAGLLPAAVMLTVGSLYWFGSAGTWSQAGDIANAIEDVRRTSLLGLVWVVAGFILFASRSWIFALFRILPTGRFFSWLLRGPLRRRLRVQRDVKWFEWQRTIATWHERGFSAASAIYRPPGYVVPAVATALAKSMNASARLGSRTQGTAEVYSTWKDRCVLMDGLTHLFAIITDTTTYQGNRQEIDAALAQWVAVAARPNAKLFLKNLAEEIYREWVTAYGRQLRYAKGIWVYPTVIGNRLAALDDYAELRYGIATDTIWERLWWVLPSTAKQEVSDARLAVEVATNLGAALLLSAAGIAMIEVARNVSWFTLSSHAKTGQRATILIIASLILAAVAYRGAVFALDALASKMSALIDLHRLHLITSLGYSPKTVLEESELWNELDHFFVQAIARSPGRKLTLPKAAQDDKTEKDDNKAGNTP
jgi:hypothetical protein